MPSASPCPPLPRPAPQRIVIRGVNWLGDSVMTTPALQRLRERFPSARIQLLVQEKLADLFLHLPTIDGVIKFEPHERPWAIARRLRREKFDLALVLPNSPRAALEVWLAGIPTRVGYEGSWRRWFLSQPVPARAGHVKMVKLSPDKIRKLTTSSAEPEARRMLIPATAHQIYDYLHLAGVLGADPSPVAPALQVTPSEVGTTAHRFGLAVHPHGMVHPLFGLNAGAEYGPAKRWPAERFIATGAELQRRTSCQWLVFGGKADVPLAEQIAEGLRRIQNEFSHHARELPAALNLAGQTSLRELCALLKLCKVLVTNDSGPMHIAAAVGTPVVVPFGSTSPELTGPVVGQQPNMHKILRAKVPCSPCFRRTCPIDLRCMTQISVEQVVDAVLAAVG